MNQTVRLFSGSSREVSGLQKLAPLWGEDFWDVQAIAQALSTPHTSLCFVGSEEDWQGMILGRETQEDAELFYIFVAPQSRGQGWARALFEAWRKGLKAESIHLEVRPSRREALSLYEALGFKIVRRRRAYYSDGEDALVMKRAVR